MNNILVVFTLLFLVSCTSYESNFSCNAKGGMGCMSLSNVNKAVNDRDVKNINDERDFFLPKTSKVMVVFGEFTEGGKRVFEMEIADE